MTRPKITNLRELCEELETRGLSIYIVKDVENMQRAYDMIATDLETVRRLWIEPPNVELILKGTIDTQAARIKFLEEENARLLAQTTKGMPPKISCDYCGAAVRSPAQLKIETGNESPVSAEALKDHNPGCSYAKPPNTTKGN